MKKIQVTPTMRYLHCNYVREKFKRRYNDWRSYYESIKREIKKKHKGFIEHEYTFSCTSSVLEICRHHLRTIAVGKWAYLRKLHKKIEGIENRIKCDPLSTKVYKQTILRVFNYDGFTKTVCTKDSIDKLHICPKQTRWSPYALVFLTGLRVCPYCNRQYITAVISPNGKMRANLDHFLPKGKYPYFSMSLYNLVPCCSSCNSSLKRNKNFGVNALNPYDCNYDDYFRFKIANIGTEHPTIDVIEEKDVKKIRIILDELLIREIYKSHDNIAREFVMKRQMYNTDFIEALWKDNSGKFINIEELMAFVVGYPLNKEKIVSEVLGKLRWDMAKAVYFI